MTGEWWAQGIVWSALFLLATWLAAKWAARREDTVIGKWQLIFLFAGALLLRLALAATTRGYGPDIGTFSAWAGHAAENLFAFYSPGYFADYPPGYIYILWLVGKLRLLLGFDFGTPPFILLLKLPSMLADIVTAWLLFRLGQRHWNSATALAATALYLFNPAVILNSAVWGQVDGCLTLFLLLGITLLEEHPAGSAASFAAALLIKPQALIFAPVPLLWFTSRLLARDRQAFANILVFAGSAVATFCLAILPFSVNQEPGWIIAKYGTTLASYPFATLNAFNFFALIGGNFTPTGEHFLFLPYSFWGYAFIALIVLFAAVASLRGREPSRFPYLPLFLCASVFVLSVKMHERYLFPALALALFFYFAGRDRRALVIFAGFSITQFLNALEVLAFSYRNVYAVPRFDPLLLVVSLANVVFWLLLVWVGYRRYIISPGKNP